MVPGVIPNLANTLPHLQKNLKIKMYDAGDKLLLKVTLDNGKVRECFLPITAVKVALYAKVDVKT
jgi:hypothetical protein